MPNSRDTESLSPPTAKGWSAKRAFTLLELLIVMAVMGLMMGLIGFTLLGGGGEELGSAQREVLGLVQQARTRAALSGAETRLIINAMEEDLEKYHRYVELVVKDTCATTNESKWLVMGEGTTLPDGVFFVPEDDSLCEVADQWKEDAYTVWSSEDDDFELMDAFKGERQGGWHEVPLSGFQLGGQCCLSIRKRRLQSSEIPSFGSRQRQPEPRRYRETYSFCRSRYDCRDFDEAIRRVRRLDSR